MKKRNGLICLAFLVCALCACTQNDELSPGKGIAPGYKTTPVQLNFSTSAMTVLGAVEADTRAEKTIVRAGAKKKNSEQEEVKSEDASSMDVVIGAPLSAETRATTAATATEKKINNINIFQFGADNKLVYVKYMSGDLSSVDADLAQTGTINKVYVVANVGQDLSSSYATGESGISETDFLKKTFAKNPTDGDLPMIGNASINMATETTLAVTLNFMVSKVVFTPSSTDMPATVGKFAITSVKLKNVPTKIAMSPLTAITADADIQILNGAVSGATTWYVPENPAGTKAGISKTDRGDYNAPKTTAMYAEVVGDFTPAGATEKSQATYQIYLGNGTATDFNVARNTVYNVSAKIKGINVSDGRVLIGTDLSAGGTQTANCYIALAKNTYYRFDATKEGKGEDVLLTNANVLGAASATGVSAKDIKVTAIAPQSAFLVWQTATAEGGTGNVIANVSLSKRNYVVFRTGSEAEGNAVIGVKDAATAATAGVVRWSWHIWKTANDPRTDKVEFAVRDNTTGAFATPWTAKTEVSMTRNLGAANNSLKNPLAGGLLYQWGRKDPFIGSKDFASGSTIPYPTTVNNSEYAWKDGSTHGSATTAVDPKTINAVGGDPIEQYAIAHPTHFLVQYNGTTYDWYAAARADQNDNLWGNPNASSSPDATHIANPKRGLKTKYDPCPHGWRVAPQNTWTSFTNNNGGYGAAWKGGNNAGTDRYKAWNVVGNNAAGTVALADVQKKFTENVGWTFYCQGDMTGTTVYFPASGYRSSLGALASVSSYGYCWAASSYGAGQVYGGLFYFGSTGVNPLGYGSRYVARPLRCVQE